MEETIFDGMPHPLPESSGTFAYIAERVQEHSTFAEVEEIKIKLLKEYIEYQLQYNKEACLEILCQHFLYGDRDIEFIYKPPHMVSSLSLHGMMAVKFIRAHGDNLS